MKTWKYFEVLKKTLGKTQKSLKPGKKQAKKTDQLN